MLDEAKARITAAIDKLAAAGQRATGLRLHPMTAQAFAIHATHLDWSSEITFPDAPSIAAELTAPDYDARPPSDPHAIGAKRTPSLFRPHDEETAQQLADNRATDHLRRSVTLAVTLDETLAVGQLAVTATPIEPHTEDA